MVDCREAPFSELEVPHPVELEVIRRSPVLLRACSIARSKLNVTSHQPQVCRIAFLSSYLSLRCPAPWSLRLIDLVQCLFLSATIRTPHNL